MSEWIRDDNNVVVMMGVSSVDWVTPLPVQIDPSTGEILAEA